MTAASQLDHAAEWVVGLRAGDVPKEVVDLARAQLVNILAAMYGGARTHVGRVVRAVLDRAGPGPVRTPTDGADRSLQDAVYLNAVLANSLELDDYVFAAHTGHAAVGVPLAVGQLVDATGEEMLLAQIAANEVAGRLGAVMMVGPQQGHMKAYACRAAATVAASRLMGLPAPVTARALAIALSAPEYPLFPSSFSPDTKVLISGDPSVAGVRAALLAAGGLDAAPDVVEHPVGLVTSLSCHEVAPPIWSRLGLTWSTQAICFKPFASCAYAAGAATAALRIADGLGRDWDPSRIEGVQVDTTVFSYSMESFSRPHRPGEITPINTNFSLARSVALALLAGTPRGELFVPERFETLRAPIADLSRRVRLTNDWEHTLRALRGLDAALDHPGRPGIYGMTESHAVMARFHDAFGTPPAVRLADVPTLLALGPSQAGYVLLRYLRGLRARLPFLGGAAARRRYLCQETDLSLLRMHLGATVRVQLDDGRVIEEEVHTPPGFAGLPGRTEVPAAKFLREVGSAAGESEARAFLSLLQEEAVPSPRRITSEAPPVREEGAEAFGR